MAVQAQWNLDSTSDSVLRVARGILQAATSDNVQPLAILACVQFGNTIAISPETCRTIETSVLPTPSPVTIQFLKAVVGYSALDCATQFGKSQAGVQFLGLASAMVTTMGCYHSSLALHEMLKSSAEDKTLLPSARQLKDLLESLEHRCQLSSFADNVLGWSIFLGRAFREVEGYPGWFIDHPSDKAIGSIVEAFRQLSRVGQSTVKTATITADFRVVPWLVAFTKWCIGIPPIVLLECGTSVLDQPDSSVIVVALPRRKSGEIEVRIQHTIPSLEQLLVSQNSSHFMNGMVTIPSYGQWMLEQFDFYAGVNSRVLDQALPHALKQVISLLRFCPVDGFVYERPGEADGIRHPSLSQYSTVRFIPFQDDHAITKTASLLLNRKFTMESKQPDELLIDDLSLVKLHFEALERSCICEKCAQLRCLEKSSTFCQCKRDSFLENLAAIIARILTISLFYFPESLRVLLLMYLETGPLVCSIQDILSTGKPVYLEFNVLLEATLALVGHDYKELAAAGIAAPRESNIVENWVASSLKGQAVFPTVFETFQIQKRGYFALSWLPGILRYDETIYSRVRSGYRPDLPETDPIIEQGKTVTRPCNLAPSIRPIWDVEVEDGFLTARLALQDTSTSGIVRQSRRSPGTLFHNLTRSLMLESCPHDSTACLDAQDRRAVYTGPMKPYSIKESSIFNVVAVDGVNDLQMFAMTSDLRGCRAVVRRNACLKCSLDVCRLANAPNLVL